MSGSNNYSKCIHFFYICRRKRHNGLMEHHNRWIADIYYEFHYQETNVIGIWPKCYKEVGQLLCAPWSGCRCPDLDTWLGLWVHMFFHERGPSIQAFQWGFDMEKMWPVSFCNIIQVIAQFGTPIHQFHWSLCTYFF